METCLGPLTAPVTTLDNRLGRRPRHLDSVDTKKKKKKSQADIPEARKSAHRSF